jgi:hypothetical protein
VAVGSNGHPQVAVPHELLHSNRVGARHEEQACRAALNNPKLKHQIEFDWLDDVFKKS